ncbi:MAG TPA: hypothetical protein VG347_24970, partial [Verrucomicrobiae bacterium]|nr:hypothetical protein [Verrucomicrobiae bacterium]
MRIILRKQIWRRARLLFAIGLGGFIGAFSLFAQPAGEVLRTAAAVRGLAVEEALEARPVHLRGTVTFFDENLYSRFIQDDTAGIYIQASTNTPPLTPGQVVEVDGASSPGEFAPIVVPAKVRVVGT